MEKEYESSTDVSNMKFIYIQNHNFELFCSKFAHILKKSNLKVGVIFVNDFKR